MTRSIQTRMTWALTTTAIVLSAGIGALLYHVIGAEMVRNFDRALEDKGQAVVSLVSLEPGAAPELDANSNLGGIPTTRLSVAGGVLDFEFNSNAMPEYQAARRPEYFQIRFIDGKPFSGSKSLGGADLPLSEPGLKRGAAFFDLKLPDGRAGRAIEIAFVPQSDQPAPAPAQPMIAVIARGRGELDENLRHLFQSLLGATVLLGMATALTSIGIVRRLLRPLRRVAEQAAAIDATTLDARFGQRELPAELAPICDRLNDLLGRLEEAFARERRFTSDVAHELRTPIAELRAIAEVALKWPDDAQVAGEAVADALAIAVQMQTLVNTLLSLVHANQRNLEIKLEPIRLAPFVDQLLSRLRAAGEVAEVQCAISDSAIVIAEPALLGSTMTNLLVNACEYGRGSGAVRCVSSESPQQVHLTIENQTQDLTQADLGRMFDPFWRKDSSRTSRAHAGLGLSLVKAYCELMGIEVRAALTQERTLQIRLIFPANNALPSDGKTSADQPARDIELSV